MMVVALTIRITLYGDILNLADLYLLGFFRSPLPQQDRRPDVCLGNSIGIPWVGVV